MTRSRRRPAERDRAQTDASPDAGGAPRDPDPEDDAVPAAPMPDHHTVLVDLAIMIGSFAGASAIAELAGAASLGNAITFGQIAFAPAACYVLLRR